jgi:hypothetical protein
VGTDFTGDIRAFVRALAVKGDGFAECVHYNAAVIAFGGMGFNFLAKLLAEVAIHEIG